MAIGSIWLTKVNPGGGQQRAKQQNKMRGEDTIMDRVTMDYERIDRKNPKWQTDLPHCENRIPAAVLRKIARKCVDVKAGANFPSGWASHVLATMLMCSLPGEHILDREIVASALMTLAELGDFDLADYPPSELP